MAGGAQAKMSTWVSKPNQSLRSEEYAYIYRLNTKIRLTMLCLSGFELYSRWVPLSLHKNVL